MEWFINNVYWNVGITEAVVRRCSVTLLKKRVFKIFQFFSERLFL